MGDQDRDREEFHRRAFHEAPIGMALVADDERILEANQALCTMLGYSREELLTKTVPDITHPDDLDAEKAYKLEVFEGRSGAFRLEKRYVTASGEIIVGRLSVSTIMDEDGKPRFFVGQLEDVTRERQAEAERERLRDELAHARRLETVGRLAGGIAHDFNNLLTAIMGCADFLERGVNDDTLRDDASQIREAASRGRELTQQLLTIARRSTPRQGHTLVDEQVGSTGKLLERVLGEHIVLELSLGAADAHVELDAGQLQSIVMNLALNGRDAMPDGGALTIATRLLGEGQVELCVGDDGHGMDPATLERIFDPFFTTKAPGDGTGLGLATVYGIVAQAQGRVWAESNEGEGTIFRVRLPQAQAPPPGASPPPKEVGPATTGLVLVVEDQAPIRQIAVRALTEEGYQVLAASNGEDALEQLGDTCVALLITDVVMPKLSGPELAERLRAKQPDLPVLYMSGFAGDVLDADDQKGSFLAKPFAPADLLKAARRTLAP